MEKFFMIYIEGQESPTIKYLSKEYAEKVARYKANEFNSKVFVLEADSVIISEEVNVIIDSYEAAVKYLGRKSGVCSCVDKHAKAMTAMYKLIVIAEAWNKADGFTPDFNNASQHKCFPWFKKQDNMEFINAGANNTAAFAFFGARLCFKSEERAIQFGTQFIDLWNDFLL